MKYDAKLLDPCPAKLEFWLHLLMHHCWFSSSHQSESTYALTYQCYYFLTMIRCMSTIVPCLNLDRKHTTAAITTTDLILFDFND